MKFKSIIQNIGANLLITILGLVGSIILARWLGPNLRGTFAAIILIPSTLQYFVNLGISSATVYFSAQSHTDKQRIWSSLIIMAFVQSIIGVLLGWKMIDSYLPKYAENTVQLGHLYLITIPLGLFGMYATYMLQGASYFKTINGLKCIVPTGYCVGIIILKIENILSITNLVFLQLLIQSCYLLIALGFLYRLILQRFLFYFDYPLTRKMLNYGLRVWFGDVSQLANSRIDQFLIGALLNSYDLGIYTIATSVAGFTGIFANAFRTIIVPTVAGESTFPKQTESTVLYFKSYWIFSIFFHLILALSVPILIPLVFGKEYIGSITICQILIMGSLFINAKTVLGGGIQAMGFPEIISIVEVFGMLVSFIFSYLLIQRDGLIGVSGAIAFAYLCQFVGLLVFMNKKEISLKKLFISSKKEINYYLSCLKTLFYK